MINRLFYVFHGVTNWLFHRECRRAYNIVYGWYEEKRDEATARLVENIDLKERLKARDAMITKLAIELEQANERLNASQNARYEAREAVRTEQKVSQALTADVERLQKQLDEANILLDVYKVGKSVHPRRKKTMEVPPA